VHEDVRADVRAVGPNDGAKLLVDANRAKQREVPLQRLEDWPLEIGLHIERPLGPVRELQAKLEALQWGRLAHTNHVSKLLKAGDLVEWLCISGLPPVRLQLLPILGCPLADQGRGATRQSALQERDVRDPKRRLLSGVVGVEVRGSMIVVVHRDDDAVELADPRHGGRVPLGLVTPGPSLTADVIADLAQFVMWRSVSGSQTQRNDGCQDHKELAI
jgi:hypothetical protein